MTNSDKIQNTFTGSLGLAVRRRRALQQREGDRLLIRAAERTEEKHLTHNFSHYFYANEIALDSRQRILVTAGDRVRIWSFGGQLLAVLTDLPLSFRRISLNPHRPLLAIAYSGYPTDFRVFVVSTSSFKTLKVLHHEFMVGFCCHGKFLVTTRDGICLLRETENFKIVRRFERENGHLHFSRDGARLLHDYRIVDVQTGRLIQTLERNNQEKPQKIDVSKDGSLVAATFPHTPSAVIWSAQTGKIINCMDKQYDHVKFGGDGQLLYATNNAKKGIDVWEPGTQSKVRTITTERCSQSIHLDGEVLGNSTKGVRNVSLYNRHTGEHLRTISDCANDGFTYGLMCGEEVLFTSGYDYIGKAYDLNTGRQISRTEGQHYEICISGDARVVATTLAGFKKEGVQLWERGTGRLLATLEVEPFHSFELNRDGRYVALGFNRKGFQVWDPHNGELVKELDGKYSIRGLSPGKDLIIADVGDSRVAVFEFHTCDLVQEISGLASTQRKVAVSGDGYTLAVLYADGRIQVFSLVSGELVNDLQSAPSAKWNQCMRLCVSSDGKRCASALGPVISIHDVASGELLQQFETAEGYSSFWLSFHRRDTRLVVGDGSKLDFRDVSDGHLLASFHPLREGFLWSTPPDTGAPNGWLWTDRPDLVHVTAPGESRGKPGDGRRAEYLATYNRRDMVMARVNDPQEYRRLLRELDDHVQGYKAGTRLAAAERGLLAGASAGRQEHR